MKAKQRSPDAGGKHAAAEVVLMALQCSQRIIQWIVLLFIAHVMSNQVAVMIDRSLQEPLNALMEQTAPIYKLAISVYFGKAAVENVLKIWNSVKSISSEDVDDTENG